MDRIETSFKFLTKTDSKTASEALHHWWQVANLPKKEVYDDDLPSVLRTFFRVKDRLDETAFTMTFKVKDEAGGAVVRLDILHDVYARDADAVIREVVCGVVSEFKGRAIECEARTGFWDRKRYEC